MSEFDIIIYCIFTVVIFLVVAVLIKNKQNMVKLLDKQQLQDDLIHSQSISIGQLEEQVNQLSLCVDEHYSENTQVSKQLEHRISIVKQNVTDIEIQIQTLAQQAPEDKFYSRAVKLAEKGADVNEIVLECEIPRAEAEMLLAVHKRKKP